MQTTNQVQSRQSWLTGILQLALASILSNLQSTKDLEWVRIEGDIATVGVTRYAANNLGSIVFVELLKVGDSFNQAEPIGTMESTKGIKDFYDPIAEKVVGVNTATHDAPELIDKE